MVSTCDHVVAVLGNEFIRLSELPQKYLEWSKDVDRFNELTIRYVVKPPLNFQFAKHCMHCGEALDVSQNYQLAKSKLECGEDNE